MTARKRAERELAENEELFRTQFSLATVGQAMLDLRGTFVKVNPALADMLGYPVDRLVGTRVDDITHPDDIATNHQVAAWLLAEETPVDRQQRLRRADGATVVAHLGMSLVRDADGRPRNFIVVVQDITARVAAEAERDAATGQLQDSYQHLQESNSRLAAANMLKLDLMGMLSHEIGTPLTAVSGYAELLLEDTETLAPEHRASVERIARAATRLETLRREVLTMCTLDAGRLQAHPEPVHVADALNEALGNLEVAVPVSCARDVRALVNPAHLQQIVTNLVTNATKYAGTATGITAEARKGHVEIHVRDDGPGVPEELRPHLFERYRRAAGTASATKGHGLGLYIVGGLAEANAGSIHYRPRSPRGTPSPCGFPSRSGSPRRPEHGRARQRAQGRSPWRRCCP